MKAGFIAAATVAAVFATLICPACILLVWNTTSSMPIGLYFVTSAAPNRGDLLVMELPPQMEALAVAWAILSPHNPVLKPVGATTGDRICRSGRAVTINGHLAAIARYADGKGRRLPIWQGCRRLSASEVFLLARHPHSFDSRYYGPLQLRLSWGIAHPLLTFPN